MKCLAPHPIFTGLRYLAWLLLKCPRTKEEVVSRLTDPIKFAGNWASWWQCPACGGWHVTMIEEWQHVAQGLEYNDGLDLVKS
jgi:hypothetical protein